MSARRQVASPRLGIPISREAELLLRVSRGKLDGPTAERIRALAAGRIDWTTIVAMVRAHRLTPIAYKHFAAGGDEVAPAHVLSALHADCQVRRVRSLHLTGELLRLLKLFESHGLQAIGFKGPALAARIYGDPAMRDFEDLDILVRWGDVPAASEILRSASYVPKVPLNHAQETSYQRVLYERGFVRRDGRAVVELHWRLTPQYCRFAGDEGRVWRRLATQRLGGQTLNVLASEDLVPLLCAHGAKHLWSRLEWVCSLGEVVRDIDAIDWDLVMREAREAGSERMVRIGLCLAHELLEVPLVPEIARSIRDDRNTTRMARRVAARLLRAPVRAASAFEIALFQLRVRERWQDGITGLVRRTFTPATTEWAAVPLPYALSRLYYLMRPVRLARKYISL